MYYFTCSFVSFFRFCRRKRDLVFFRKKIKYRQFCILDDLKIAAISEKNVLSSLDRQSPSNHVPILTWLFKIIYVKLLFCFCLYDLFKVSWKTMRTAGRPVLSFRFNGPKSKINILAFKNTYPANAAVCPRPSPG